MPYLLRDPLQAARELLTASEPFAAICFPEEAPDDSYTLPSDQRIKPPQVRALRQARARLTILLAERDRLGGDRA